jgi:hypothetical protein
VNGLSLPRRLIAGLALFAYLVTSAGFLPLPALPSKKKSGTPFPCQDHPCGCSSAEECWRHCCCFSVEERWAWAAANQVEPPEYAEKPANAGWSTARLRDQAESPKSCEHAKHAGCCETRALHSGREHQPSTTEPAPPTRPLCFLTAARCQGLSATCVAVGPVLPILPTHAARLDHSPSDRLSYPDTLPFILSLVPPDPPPRLA